MVIEPPRPELAQASRALRRRVLRLPELRRSGIVDGGSRASARITVR